MISYRKVISFSLAIVLLLSFCSPVATTELGTFSNELLLSTNVDFNEAEEENPNQDGLDALNFKDSNFDSHFDSYFDPHSHYNSNFDDSFASFSADLSPNSHGVQGLPSGPPANSISGFLWADGNGMASTCWNGFYDSTESPLFSYPVFLYFANDLMTPIIQTQTGFDEKYLFENLAPNDYVLGLVSSTVNDEEYLLPFFPVFQIYHISKKT